MSDCPLHAYSEQSARDKLTRHHLRGDWTHVMRYHHDCGNWHVDRLIDTQSDEVEP